VLKSLRYGKSLAKQKETNILRKLALLREAVRGVTEEGALGCSVLSIEDTVPNPPLPFWPLTNHIS
jgi:hypothetical protein